LSNYFDLLFLLTVVDEAVLRLQVSTVTSQMLQHTACVTEDVSKTVSEIGGVAVGRWCRPVCPLATERDRCAGTSSKSRREIERR